MSVTNLFWDLVAKDLHVSKAQAKEWGHAVMYGGSLNDPWILYLTYHAMDYHMRNIKEELQ